MNKMLKKIIRILFLIAGTVGAVYGSNILISKVEFIPDSLNDIRLIGAVGAIGGLICYAIAPLIIKIISDPLRWIEAKLQRTPTQDIILGAFGLTIGLIIGTLIGLTLRNVPFIGPFLPIVTDLLFGSMGIFVAIHKEELSNLFTFFPKSVERVVSSKDRAKVNLKSLYKILDTSVVIDGQLQIYVIVGF